MTPTPPQAFNLFDAIQNGITSLKNNTVSVMKTNAGLAVAAGLLIAVLVKVFLGDAPEAKIQLMAMNNDIGGLLIATVMSILLLAVQVALAMLFITRAYIQIRNATPRGFAYTLGSNDPPLFRLSQEEAMVTRATFLRFWRLWPFVVAYLLATLTIQLGAELWVQRLSGNRIPPGLQAIYYFMWLVVFAFLFWTAYRLVRLFFYMVPAAVEQGSVDLSIIKSMAPSKALYRAVATSTFWKHIVIVVLSILPVFGLQWLFTAFLDLIDISRRGFVADLAFFILRHFGFLVGAVFFVGVLSVILEPKENQEEALPTGAA